MLEKDMGSFWPLPWKPNVEVSTVHEDMELPDQENRAIKWYSLNLTVTPKLILPLMSLTQCLMGCEYVNTHNQAIGDVFNCKTNVQVGDGSHGFYCTCYLSK